jgi:hypothetical protein
MKIEHDGDIYETVISKPILEGDYYYDCMTHEVKKCKTYICFDPWSLKMEIIKEHETTDE